MKKGLRHHLVNNLVAVLGPKTSPDEKGIKTAVKESLGLSLDCPKTSPDEKGIKTAVKESLGLSLDCPKTSPDEKGIKTPCTRQAIE